MMERKSSRVRSRHALMLTPPGSTSHSPFPNAGRQMSDGSWSA
jgi:hypothetical protein